MSDKALETYQSLFALYSEKGPFSYSLDEKNAILLPLLNNLTHFHREECEYFRNIMRTHFASGDADCLTSVPYVMVRLFKLLDMKSIEEQDVFRRLQSSGTSAQVTSKVALDRATSQRQSKTLVSIMQTILGKQRLPMLIIDKPSIVAKGAPFNARAAGIQGLAFLGRDHTYALNEDMSLNREAIKTFYQKYKGEKVLVFGFTFMIWQYLVLNLLEDKLDVRFDNAVVLHGGGWKKLTSEAVSNDMFKQGMYDSLGISSVHNFYGMAEQVGSVFLECNQGYLHAPGYSDVIIRDPNTHRVQPHGKLGQIQVLSSVPTSYAGHSILTEDLGIIHGHDDCKCGWKGAYFTVTGRMPKVEVRGCSDTHTGGGGE